MHAPPRIFQPATHAPPRIFELATRASPQVIFQRLLEHVNGLSLSEHLHKNTLGACPNSQMASYEISTSKNV
eukprot:229925-Pleurochrysis_carterae.AAC.2